MKVAIQGERGSFHAIATHQWFGKNAELVPCASFAEVFHALAENQVETIITAVENTVYGSINEVYQLIEEAAVPIVGEIKLPVAQQLIGLADTPLHAIKEVYSHPVALAQCRKTIEALLPQAKMIEWYDTAASVAHIKELNDPSKAAIASSDAAHLHDMAILHADIHDSPHNITRFLVISAEVNHQPKAPNRASMVITTTHKPGALAEVLQIFAVSDINLVKLQSQPIVGEPWQYKFFVVADVAGTKLQTCIEQIRATGHNVKLLGEYVAA